MTCLACGLEAKETNESYDGVPLRICEQGHRTGELLEAKAENAA